MNHQGMIPVFGGAADGAFLDRYYLLHEATVFENRDGSSTEYKRRATTIDGNIYAIFVVSEMSDEKAEELLKAEIERIAP